MRLRMLGAAEDNSGQASYAPSLKCAGERQLSRGLQPVGQVPRTRSTACIHTVLLITDWASSQRSNISPDPSQSPASDCPRSPLYFCDCARQQVSERPDARLSVASHGK